MNRNEMLRRLTEKNEWDIIIIGGGATGLGTAVDAATRGYSTLLLERQDFAKGTSSRSTKLVHGGVRYLAQGNIKLVREALKERGCLLKNAPHVTSKLSFVLPCYSIWQKIYYGIGLKIYDLMSLNQGLGSTKIFGSNKTKALLPTLDATKLKGSVVYTDGQFDDARLAINLAKTAAEHSATLFNYFTVTGFLKSADKVTGVIALDEISGKQHTLKSKVVINATGVFTDEILQLDDVHAENIVSPSQGVHLVIDKEFFPGEAAMMIPRTADGRVLFAVPWHDKVVLGTTDTPVEKHSTEPMPLDEEIEFILGHINKYLAVAIKRSDVNAAFVGLRPLVKKGVSKKTSLMPRDHTILISESGLVTITGGKWTTYRKMANDVLNNAVFAAGLEKRSSVTANLKIHGWVSESGKNDPLHFYGSDGMLIRDLCKENGSWLEKIHPGLPNILAEVIWAIRNEMAMTLEDVLARRTRILFLDARAAMEAAPVVAALMAKEMNKNDDWIQQQINEFCFVAKQYVLS